VVGNAPCPCIVTQHDSGPSNRVDTEVIGKGELESKVNSWQTLLWAGFDVPHNFSGRQKEVLLELFTNI